MEQPDLLAPLPGLLLPWFRANARPLPWRQDREPYHVWLSEIMLQQTRVEAVKDYYRRFLQALPTVADLAQCDPDRLHKLWEGLGYYSRVRNLQAAAKEIMSTHHGVFPTDYAAVRALKGIGDYTAGAIVSICFDRPVPAVDGNVLRVVTRLLDDPSPVTDPATVRRIRQRLAAVYPAQGCGTFTQSLMELGATVCVPNGAPRCEVCPLAGLCRARAAGTQLSLPVKAKKKPRRTEQLTVLVLRRDGQYALRRRGRKGLLAGLWEFPNVPGHLEAGQAVALAEQWGVHPAGLGKVLERTHIFTHVEWQMRCYYLDCRAAGEGFTWADRDALEQAYALPTAFRMFREE